MLVACSCGKQMDVADNLAGRWIRCPRCRAKMKVQAARDEDLPIALDHPPPPEALAAQADASTEIPDAPPEILSDLAAAISDVNGHGRTAPSAPADTSGLPLATSKPPAATQRPARGGDEGGAEILGDLAAAISETGGTSAPPARATASDVPLALSKPRRVSGPRSKGVAVAQLADDEDPPEKKRDLLPLIITGAAAVILVGLIVGMVVMRTGGSSSSTPEQAAAPQVQQTAPVPAHMDDEYERGTYDFFGHVKPNRTSKDYLEEREKKQNTP